MGVTFDPILAEIRFGCGLSPVVAGPKSIGDMIAQARGADHMATRYPIDSYDIFAERVAAASRYRGIMRKKSGTQAADDARAARQIVRRDAHDAQYRWFWQTMQRRIWTQDGLRERLSYFWADHFTARGKGGILKRANAPYVEDAIRPHIMGRFSDMLRAVITQPLMLHYLDQQRSVGPNSLKAVRKGNRGLNENLARELLELHTLGVDGPYGQSDVRELAELLTGLTFSRKGDFSFRKKLSEPGLETVLGVRYGGDPAELSHIYKLLDDLSVHPATARHIAGKLAVHFVGDAPDTELIAALEARYLATRGDLGEVIGALLAHPAAWNDAGGNVKPPVDYVGSALRALAVPSGAIGENTKQISAVLLAPMVLMGQSWEAPLGPDGWPENDAEWITPQRFAARLDWAMSAPGVLRPDLPDPREFVETALGGRAPSAVLFAANGAEDRRVGVGIVLASPAFQRT